MAALRIRSGPPVSALVLGEPGDPALVLVPHGGQRDARSGCRIDSRYQYIGAVLLLLVAADLADGVGRPDRTADRDRARRRRRLGGSATCRLCTTPTRALKDLTPTNAEGWPDSRSNPTARILRSC